MRIVFLGTPLASVPSLRRCIADGHELVAVYTQPDRPAGRGQKITVSPVKEEAKEKGIQIYQPTKLRIPESIDLFRDHGADVAVVVAYGRILPKEYLYAFPNGAINVHFSLLPKYRGAAPVNWAIAEGEKTTGVTTMRMDEGLDTGDILLQSSTPLRSDENSIELMTRLSDSGADLLSKTLANLGSIEPKKQNDELASYARILKKEDGDIDWRLPAGRIADRVRGFQPFPGTYTYYQGTRLNISRAVESTDHDALSKSPGEILSITNEELLVQCGDGTVLAVHELQQQGKRRMTVRDFINGSKLSIGALLERNNDER